MDRSTAVSNSQPPQYISIIINHIWGLCWTLTPLIRFKGEPGTERVWENLISTARCVDSDFPLLIATLQDEKRRGTRARYDPVTWGESTINETVLQICRCWLWDNSRELTHQKDWIAFGEGRHKSNPSKRKGRSYFPTFCKLCDHWTTFHLFN